MLLLYGELKRGRRNPWKNDDFQAEAVAIYNIYYSSYLAVILASKEKITTHVCIRWI